MLAKEAFIEFSYKLLAELLGTEGEQKVRDYIKGLRENTLPNWEALAITNYPQIMMEHSRLIPHEEIVEAFRTGNEKVILRKAQRAIRMIELYRELLGLH